MRTLGFCKPPERAKERTDKMSNNIGAGVRAKQIAKWKDGVAKNVDLLVAFPSERIDDDVLAEFRGVVAERIKGLADYLTTGQWGLFDGQPLMPPPSKEEREAQAEENAARAEAERNAEAVEAVAEAISKSPLALPEPKCVHWDETKNGCGHPDNPRVGLKCEGYCSECVKFSIATPPADNKPKKTAKKSAKKSAKKPSKKGGKK